MDKLLFVVPPHLCFEDFMNPLDNVRVVHRHGRAYGSVITDAPLGVLSLSAYVKAHINIETRLLDFNVELNRLNSYAYSAFDELFVDHLLALVGTEDEPDVIGISSLFMSSYRHVLAIAQYCRVLFPRAIIVAGGGIPTNCYRDLYRDSDAFDGLCFGEGERPLLGLLRATDRRQYLIASPAWITGAKLVQDDMPQPDALEDLDAIPFYDYVLLGDGYNLNPTTATYGSLEGRHKSVPVMTSRGCRFRCCYCSSHTVHGRMMRYHSLERVRKDLGRLRDEHGAEIIVFQDDDFLADKTRGKAIIAMLGEMGLTPFFQNALAMHALDREMLETLKAADVNQLVLAIESGSDRVLKKIMHKATSRRIIERVTTDCRDLGIYADANLVVGVPGETPADIEEGREFLRSLGVNWFRVYVATPLVGSDMHAICVERGYLRGDLTNCGYKHSIVETEDFTSEYVDETAYSLNLDLNFVHNSDMRLGDYATALKGFEAAIRAKSDHALAYHYAAKGYGALGEIDKATAYRERARAVVKGSAFWQRWVERFGIEELQEMGCVRV